MSVLTGLFNVFALLYIFRAIQLAVSIGRNWQDVRQEPLTRAKQRLAEQAAFFISVPISVFFHELFHALAVWLFGGTVVEFGYRVFWGYVVPAGSFSAAQNWFIAVAGTLGSLLFGCLAWLLLRDNPSRSLQYFGLRTFRFQIYFSLLYYPLFSLFLPVGDWRTIYDFSATPLLSGLTAAAHLGGLLWFWRLDRQGWFEMVAFDSLADQQRYQQLQAQAADPRAGLQQIDALRRGGAPHQAQMALAGFLAQHPELPDGYLQQAALLSDGKAEVPGAAAAAAEQALARGIVGPGQFVFANELVARHSLQKGDGATAEAQLSRALPAAETLQATPADMARLYYLRSQALRRQARHDEAYRDARRANLLADAAGDAQAAARYLAEMELIEKHAGRQLSGKSLDESVTEPSPHGP